jgi:hypothetical protein
MIMCALCVVFQDSWYWIPDAQKVYVCVRSKDQTTFTSANGQVRASRPMRRVLFRTRHSLYFTLQWTVTETRTVEQVHAVCLQRFSVDGKDRAKIVPITDYKMLMEADTQDLVCRIRLPSCSWRATQHSIPSRFV